MFRVPLQHRNAGRMKRRFRKRRSGLTSCAASNEPYKDWIKSKHGNLPFHPEVLATASAELQCRAFPQQSTLTRGPEKKQSGTEDGRGMPTHFSSVIVKHGLFRSQFASQAWHPSGPNFFEALTVSEEMDISGLWRPNVVPRVMVMSFALPGCSSGYFQRKSKRLST